MEKEWPPLRTCPQYEFCMIRGYVDGKFPWEDNEGNWFKMYKRYKRPVQVERMREEHRIAKKFLHQVRTTRGYGVTCHYPLRHWSFRPLRESQSQWNRNESVNKAIESTLNHIFQKTGEAYELVKIENVVKYPENFMWLLTIVAKKRNSVPETFLSMVCQMSKYSVMECLLKPDCKADWGADEEKVLYELREGGDD